MVADPETINQLTLIAYNHHPKIQKVDTVRAFYFGTEIIAEVDIVLPDTTLLKESHDIGESLQESLEKLDFVGRVCVYGGEHCAPLGDVLRTGGVTAARTTTMLMVAGMMLMVLVTMMMAVTMMVVVLVVALCLDSYRQRAFLSLMPGF